MLDGRLRGRRPGRRARRDHARGRSNFGALPDGQRPDPAGAPASAATPTALAKLRRGDRPAASTPPRPPELGLVTFAPDDIDWDDEVRIALEERAQLQPGRAHRHGGQPPLRRPGDAWRRKIFGRLSAWQNWIFKRPNAVRPGRRAAPLRHRAARRLRPEASVSMTTRRLRREDPEQRRPAEDRRLQRALESLAAELPQLVGDDGPGAADRGRLPAHRGQRRPRGLGALRPRGDAGLPLGHLPGRAQPRPAHRASASTRASRSGSRCRASTAPTCSG